MMFQLVSSCHAQFSVADLSMPPASIPLPSLKWCHSFPSLSWRLCIISENFTFPVVLATGGPESTVNSTYLLCVPTLPHSSVDCDQALTALLKSDT